MFIKICPVEAEFFQCGQMDGQTDKTSLTVVFSSFHKNKVQVALQKIKPGFSTAEKFKVNLDPGYIPEFACHRNTLYVLKFVTCSLLRSVNTQVSTDSFH